LHRENAQSRGPSIAFNTGLNLAIGEVILINNADCLHWGDIIGYVFDLFKPDTYLTFAAYKGMALPDGIFDNLDWNDEGRMNYVDMKFDVNNKKNWHLHSLLSPKVEDYALVPYSATISRKNMEILNGIDERFCLGIGYEDSDFLVRVNNLGLKSILVDHPFCVHQKHPPTVYSNNINYDFFYSLQRDFPDRIKAPINTVYNR
jgi:hypothetical protein